MRKNPVRASLADGIVESLPNYRFHQGSFFIFLMAHAKRTEVPRAVRKTWDREKLLVVNGSFTVAERIVQFRSGKNGTETFAWGRKCLRKITDLEGNVLWQRIDIEQ
ncbi:MAG: hypothetical protein KGH93_02155 [Patescibacteria group bacterium]|nr:hypothetical protein [Patescibacteria group bacterium]MDE1945980.1 hypothetical protein [Patescibacteria group bacterium]